MISPVSTERVWMILFFYPRLQKPQSLRLKPQSLYGWNQHFYRSKITTSVRSAMLNRHVARLPTSMFGWQNHVKPFILSAWLPTFSVASANHF